MNPGAAVCPNCQRALNREFWNTPEPVHCPECDTTVQLHIFPALFRQTASGPSAETILEEGTSSCFYHEKKKAVVHCDGCGRFLCSLCDVEFNGRHLCPTCLNAGRTKGKMANLDNKRTLYDSAAVTLCLAPLLIWPLTIITAPLALFLAIRSFSRPSSVVPRTRARAWIAVVVSLLQITGWAFFLWSMLTAKK
jgi:hypothetical protein